MSSYRWLVVLLLVVALLLRVDFIYYILYVVIGIFLWSRWYASRAMKHLRVGRVFDKRAFLGEIVEVTITIRNESRLSVPWLQVTESIPPELRMEEPLRRVLSLGGRDEVRLTYHVRGQQRGYYRLGPMRLAAGDLFGLAESRDSQLGSEFLTVYPRILPLADLGLPSRLPFGTIASRQRMFEDPARPMGVRAYRSGDSPRQVNWKASAHVDQLLVRRLEPAISLETVILLNLNRDDYERRDRQYSTEWAVVIAASVANHLIAQRQAVGLMSNGVDPLRLGEERREYDETTGRLMFREADGARTEYLGATIPPRTGRAHLMKLLEQLARLENDTTMPLVSWASSVVAGLNWGVTLLIITSTGDVATCNAVHRLVRSGYNPILVAVEPDANFGLVRERARRLGFVAHNVSGRASLDLWQAHSAALPQPERRP
jgi:uncharacterized protein (DUF58 family)